MNLPDRLSLTAESWQQHFRHRSYFVLLDDFLPRSFAQRDIRFDPAATWEEISALLPGFHNFDLELGRWRLRMAFKRNGQVVEIDSARGSAHIEALCDSHDALAVLDEVCKALETMSPPEDKERSDGVWADTCLLGKYGARTVAQFVRCPEWDSVRGNYVEGTRAAIDELLALPEPAKRGQLVIWHGPTGTGKTWALRAAMRSWRERYVPTVLADPEKFARNPEYYLELASEPEDLARLLDIDDVLDPPATRKPDSKPRPRRRLFILEDSASLILRHGESGSDILGRLLNMTDGLLGQGREDLFLITFNEEVEQIDPAFLRPGRCVAHVRFPLLPRAMATEWLRQKGQASPEVGDATSLAELFARAGCGPIRDTEDEALKVPKGFAVKRKERP